MNAFRFFLIHPMCLFLVIFFDGIILKKEEICDPMEKIWIKRSCIFKVMNL